ncbi:MAG: PAS domain-containing protein [Planctomycetes bacterium]|nr:PAS domain-containing protein [Planctomycetota bacterium]
MEFLLRTVDLEMSARQALQWLAKYGDVRRSICVSTDASGKHLIGVWGHGVTRPSTWDLSIDLADSDHPLVALLGSKEPAYFPANSASVETPLGDTSFHAIQLRGNESQGDLADGLLLVESSDSRISAETRWLAEVLGEQVARLRSRQSLAQAQFARERMLLHSIINAVTDPILLTNSEGKLIIANSRAEKLLAAPDDASEGWRQAVTLNNMLFSAALSTSAMESNEPLRRELVLVDPNDGSDLLFEILSTSVKDAREGSFAVSILRNVTDLGRATKEIEESRAKLRVAETEVREERHRLELIIDSVADPILVTDAAGDIVMMNDPAERLFTVKEQSDDSEQRRVHANGAHFSSFVSNLLFSGTESRWRGEISLVDPTEGTPMPVEAVAGKVLSDKGELTWVVTILHDRTEAMERANLYEQLKRASEQLEAKVHAATAELAQQNELLRRQALELEQASALKSQFLANMSHEFRTPLNAILGYTFMLLNGVTGELSPGQRRNLERVDSNSRHLLALINDILDITRIEAGRMPLHVSRFGLSELVSEVLSELEPIIARSRLTMRTHISPRIVFWSDRQKVKQILLNLISNALKFTHHGSVTIHANRDASAGAIRVAVSDTGIGIGKSNYERVFEDFRQLDSSTTRVFSGTGLGLSICRRLATMLGGSISLQSKVGEGSTFTLQLPERMRRK